MTAIASTSGAAHVIGCSVLHGIHGIGGPRPRVRVVVVVASRSAKGWETVDTTRQWRIQRRLHATNDQAAVSAPTEEPRGTTRRRHSAAPLLPQGNQNQHSGPNVWAGRIVKGQAPVGPPPIGPRTQTSPEPNTSRPHHHHIGRPHSPR